MSRTMEPVIVINGVRLTDAQAMTVRVAVGSFTTSLDDPEQLEALGAIGPAYQERVREVVTLMMNLRPHGNRQ